MPPRSGRGDFNAVTDPTRFTATAIQDSFRKNQKEQKVFDQQDGSAVSKALLVGNAEKWTVYSSGTGEAKVYGTINPTSGFWVELSSLSGTDFYENDGHHPWIKIETQSNANNLDIWLYIKFAIY